MSSRIRSVDEYNILCPCLRTNVFKNSASTHSSSYWANVGITKSMTDIVTPGFKRLKNDGAIINNPMNSFYFQQSNTPASQTITRAGKAPDGGFIGCTWSDISSIVCSSVSPTRIPWCDIDTASIEADVITKAFAGVGKPDVQLLVSLAESKQALSLLKNPILGVIKMLRASKVKDLRRFSEGAANQWLATQFGILPMIMDLQGIMKALSRTAESRLRETSRATAQDSVSILIPGGSYKDTLIELRASLGLADTFVARAGVLYEHELELIDFLGLSASYIPSSLWEHMPWSFVFDYLMNIGNVIDALTPKVRTYVKTAWIASERNLHCNEWVTYCDVTDVARTNLWSSTGGFGSRSSHIRTKARRPVDRTDIRLVWTPNISIRRVANLGALLTQALSGKRTVRS